MHITTITAAAEAIAESVRHTIIVTVDDAPGLREDLLFRCDDDIENGSEHEFWGQDDEGNDWRVHVRIAGRGAGAADGV